MKRIDFLATDGVVLNGILYNGNNENSNVILAIHGMSSNCFKKRDEIISQYANNNNIDYFCFNNRGSDLVKYIRKNINGKDEKILAGTSYEDVSESYEDIVGAIFKLKELGYKNIYLQGHSLGCTKIVYTYNELKEDGDNILDNVKGVILLSLIDIPMAIKVYLKEKYQVYLSLAEEKEKAGLKNEFMPKEAFIHPISVKTFLRYVRDNKYIDFARYGQNDEFVKLNNIDCPLFMRWGNNNDMIIQKAEALVQEISSKLSNRNKDIDYIDGADHGYTGKEEVVAKQIVEFINSNKR